MLNKNRILCKFSDVGIPDIVITTDCVRVSSVNTEKNVNKTNVIDAIVDQEKGVKKD